MNGQGKGPLDQRDPNDTAAATFVSVGIMPPQPNNPIADEIAWQRQMIACMNDRILVRIALFWRDADPRSNRGAYLWRELTRLELRRRKGGAS